MGALKAILALTLFTFSGFFLMSLIRLAIPLLLAEERTPLLLIGAAMTSYSLAIMLSSAPFGRASDRLGRARVASLGILLMLMASSLLLLAQGFLAIVAALLLLGVGWAAFEPSMAAMVGDLAEPSKVGRAYGTFSTSLQAGLSSGPAAAGFLISLYGFRAPFQLAVPMALVMLLGMQLLFKGLKGALARRERVREEATLASLLKGREILAGWASIMTSFTIIGGFEAFFPIYAKLIGLEPWMIGLLFSSVFITGVFIRLPMGLLLDRLRDKLPAIIVGLLLHALGVALVPLFDDPLTLLPILVLISSSRSATNIGGMALVALGSTPNNRGLALGFTATFRHGGFALGPTIFSSVASLWALPLGFLALASTALPGSLLLSALRKGFQGLERKEESLV